MSHHVTVATSDVKGKPVETPQGKSWADRVRQGIGDAVLDAVIKSAPKLAHIAPFRRAVVKGYERYMRAASRRMVASGSRLAEVEKDRLDMGLAILHTVARAIAERRLGDTHMRAALNNLIRDALVRQGDRAAVERFAAKYGCPPPSVLLVSPTKACNLRCTGCYADSGPAREKLEWDIFERTIREAHDLWGARFFVFSGGEPLIYRDEGKGVLDLVERFPDCFFMMYTNGTLIDDKTARRLKEVANLTPAISIEGLKEQTDARRGEGIFDCVLEAMRRLRREQVIFGISLTALRQNAEYVLSDEVVNFFFDEMGASYAWIFHYMPIGRAYTLELMPTPEQRFRMWQRTWQLVRERHLMVADFWNSGIAADGCISAGRPGGYMAIDWNGAVMPCVFTPYSPVNIRTAYAEGKTLNDVWAEPFFASIRAWQRAYGYKENYLSDEHCGNRIMPCPIRDHHAEFQRMVMEHEPDPTDENARDALLDAEYHQGLEEFDRNLAAILDPIWESHYLRKRRYP